MVKADDMVDDVVSAQRDLAERAQVEPLLTLPIADAFHQVLETCGETTITYSVDNECAAACNKENYPFPWLTVVTPLVYSVGVYWPTSACFLLGSAT